MDLFLLFMVPTGTGNQGKPGKMGRHFPVREKSGNFVKTGKVREKSGNFAQNTGKTGKFSGTRWIEDKKVADRAI